MSVEYHSVPTITSLFSPFTLCLLQATLNVWNIPLLNINTAPFQCLRVTRLLTEPQEFARLKMLLMRPIPNTCGLFTFLRRRQWNCSLNLR